MVRWNQMKEGNIAAREGDRYRDKILSEEREQL